MGAYAGGGAALAAQATATAAKPACATLGLRRQPLKLPAMPGEAHKWQGLLPAAPSQAAESRAAPPAIRLAPPCDPAATPLHPHAAQASQNEIRTALESSDEDAKVEAMQKAITAILAGEQLPALFITIVRYVLPSENHMVQKLLLLYLVSRAGVGGHLWLIVCHGMLCAAAEFSPTDAGPARHHAST